MVRIKFRYAAAYSGWEWCEEADSESEALEIAEDLMIDETADYIGDGWSYSNDDYDVIREFE